MNFTSKEPITRGFSVDKKYCVTDESGKRYFLRLSDISQHDSKLFEFNMMKKLANLGVPMCMPLEFGICDEGVYSIQSWIEGNDAKDVLSELTEAGQYALGLKAGQIQRTIHSIKAPEAYPDWEIIFNQKIDKKLENYAKCPLKCENDHIFIEYITANRHLLRNRPRVYQHGDYHSGNMMIDKNGKLYIIDFNREDYGDPWEDIKSIFWDSPNFPAFARGRIDGYFEGNIPDGFWPSLKLYQFCSAITSIPWALGALARGIPGQDRVMLNKAKEILSWYEDSESPVPRWYNG